MFLIRSAYGKVLLLSAAQLLLMIFIGTAKATPISLVNLQEAYAGERNAHARYLAFAQKADVEGYGGIASLFRAAARAEEIHAANHAAVIQEIGVVPHSHVEIPVVHSTRENLEAAIKGESYERDTMYPEFLKQARFDRINSAIRSLNLAKTAEAEHAKLFQEALSNIDHLRGSTVAYFLVCPTCGFTVRNLDFEKCPSCFTSKEAFEQVS